MRIRALTPLLVFAGALCLPAHGAENLFACVEQDTLSVDAQCVETNIEQNLEYREMQMSFQRSVADINDNAMATATFFPQHMLIEIVAHQEQQQQAIAMVSADR
ncbi:hypothetical protein LJ739_18465 [Aestuariibacter halophilus]|uniref:Uncharacterized protein n=1 Tax=Fluctibacter halophilus TaxID=226011 RepID=A0ABS8GCG0_9ALTE|nr:hypothetical protein [Aestuariibacter halophilus]MCC2618247.1 hypothetical protein [Aestuariibacter halophilus]